MKGFLETLYFGLWGAPVLIKGITKHDISDLIKLHLFMILLGITGAVSLAQAVRDILTPKSKQGGSKANTI